MFNFLYNNSHKLHHNTLTFLISIHTACKFEQDSAIANISKQTFLCYFRRQAKTVWIMDVNRPVYDRMVLYLRTKLHSELHPYGTQFAFECLTPKQLRTCQYLLHCNQFLIQTFEWKTTCERWMLCESPWHWLTLHLTAGRGSRKIKEE